MDTATFLGLSPLWWTAIGAMATAIITLILVIVGYTQIRETRHQNQRWATIAVCDQYHLDFVLGRSLRRLSVARAANKIDGHEREYQFDVTRVLNYLDGLAIGIAQGMYVEALARDHMQSIVKTHVQQYLKDGKPKLFDIEIEDFRYLTALELRWAAISRPHFQQ